MSDFLIGIILIILIVLVVYFKYKHKKKYMCKNCCKKYYCDDKK